LQIVFISPPKKHRVAWCHFYGTWPANEIDHINHDRADNRIAKLRDILKNENQWNQRNPRGTAYICGRWYAYIRKNGVQSYIAGSGSATEEEAHQAYLSAKTHIHHSWPGMTSENRYPVHGDTGYKKSF
jgi:hypothetical protein